MVLGHEASGTVVEVGGAVKNLKPGDRVCMFWNPAFLIPNSRAARLGIYNLDPAVRFWATPPVHGCLTPYVTHPAAYTFKLPTNVSFAEGAMVEPLAVGMHATVKAKVKPGDLGVVMGAGPIGIVTALAALAGGCSQIVITDVQQPKLDLAARLGPIRPVNVAKENLRAVIDDLTEGWGPILYLRRVERGLPSKLYMNLCAPADVLSLLDSLFDLCRWTLLHLAPRKPQSRRCSDTLTSIRAHWLSWVRAESTLSR